MNNQFLFIATSIVSTGNVVLVALYWYLQKRTRANMEYAKYLLEKAKALYQRMENERIEHSERLNKIIQEIDNANSTQG